MNVFIKEGGEKPKKFRIILPTSLIFNRFTAGFAAKEAEKNGAKISKKQMINLFKAIKKYKKRHRDWVLAYIESSDGDIVKVKL